MAPYAEDIALVEAVARRESAAWARFVERHEPTIRYAMIRVATRFQASLTETQVEDLVADLFLRLVRNDARRLRKYTGRSSLRQWIKVVASNFAVDHLRRRRGTLSIATSADAEPGPGAVSPDAFVDESPDPHELLEEREQRQAVVELFATLSAEDRAFVELYYARGLPYEEVAELMGTTLGAVYARRNRIRKKLTAAARERALI